jgi:four helix bundle protein
VSSLRTFEDLDCWKKASQLRRDLFELVKAFPSEEKYRLIDQIIRASRSVRANIAEGYGRFHYQEYVQYCRQSRGSLYELIDHLRDAYEIKLISQGDFEKFKNQVSDCIVVINGFINYLLGAKEQNRVEEPVAEYRLTNSHLAIN